MARLVRSVSPVGGAAFLGRVVHFDRADLDFEHKTVAVSNTCVKALVPVDLRFGDVVLEPKRLRIEEPMGGIECEVAGVLAQWISQASPLAMRHHSRRRFPSACSRVALNREYGAPFRVE